MAVIFDEIAGKPCPGCGGGDQIEILNLGGIQKDGMVFHSRDCLDEFEQLGRPLKTQEELWQLAIEMMGGSVFTSYGLDPQDIGMVFMPLMLMDSEQRKRVIDILAPGLLESGDPDLSIPTGMIYEYMDKAGPRSVNGLPMFYSFQILTPWEHSRVRANIDRIMRMKP